MTAQAIIAIASLAAGIVGLVLYVIKRRDSPEALYHQAVEAYEGALKAEQEATDVLQKELDKPTPDGERVRALSAARRAAGERVLAAKTERDRLRPPGR